jgi:hypothetical protein
VTVPSSKHADRRTVDLSAYPDLVVICLGMRVNRIAGLRTLIGFGPKIAKAAEPKPEGLLSHESFLWSLFPMHAGIRQYWRDFPSLERWARSDPHRVWWQNFLRDTGGTGFWHETYFRSGGIEAIYDDVPSPIAGRCFPHASEPNCKAKPPWPRRFQKRNITAIRRRTLLQSANRAATSRRYCLIPLLVLAMPRRG